MSRLTRMLMTVAAGAWLGGMVLIAIVAQTTFSVMRTTGAPNPNALAGQVMAKNFSRFDVVQGICAGVLILGQVVLLALGRRGVRDGVRTILIGASAVLLAYGALVLTPRITAMQADVSGAGSEDAVRALFEEFHRTAVLIAKINLGVVLALALELAWPALPGKMKTEVT